jgi:hypothetical protein
MQCPGNPLTLCYGSGVPSPRAPAAPHYVLSEKWELRLCAELAWTASRGNSCGDGPIVRQEQIQSGLPEVDPRRGGAGGWGRGPPAAFQVSGYL